MNCIANTQHSSFLPCFRNLVIDRPPKGREHFDVNCLIADHLMQALDNLLERRICDVCVFVRGMHRHDKFVPRSDHSKITTGRPSRCIRVEYPVQTCWAMREVLCQICLDVHVERRVELLANDRNF